MFQLPECLNYLICWWLYGYRIGVKYYHYKINGLKIINGRMWIKILYICHNTVLRTVTGFLLISSELHLHNEPHNEVRMLPVQIPTDSVLMSTTRRQLTPL